MLGDRTCFGDLFGRGRLPQPPNASGIFSRVGRVEFDGIGAFKADVQTNYNGSSSHEAFDGTYSVDSKCTFSISYLAGAGRPFVWAGMLTDSTRGANVMISYPQGAVVTGTLVQQ